MSGPFPGDLGARYLAEGMLGRGGMGEVWRARDRRLGRPVAVKLMLASEDPQAVALFRREAATLARLRHPGVVEVYDHGVVDGRPYLVMELLEGESLDRGAGGLDLAGLASAVTEALLAVHEEGLVHRDLKPGNLFRCADGRLVLTDFGIALAPTEERLTATGLIRGTPGFLPPEAFRGEPPAPAWDWWALGATIYALAEGRVPYDMETLTRAAGGGDLPPLDFRAGGDPGLRDRVRALLRCDPGRRMLAAGSGEDGPAPAPTPAPAPASATQVVSPASVEDDSAPATTSPAVALPPSQGRWWCARWWGAATLLAVGLVWWAIRPGLPPPRATPAPSPAKASPRWPAPFPRELGAAVSAELRDLEGLVVRADGAVEPGGEGPALLAPDPLQWWEVVRRVPSLLLAVEWVTDNPDAAREPVVIAALAAADRVLEGQLLLPAFRAARQPAPRDAATWKELGADHWTELASEAPPSPWLVRSCRAFDAAVAAQAAGSRRYQAYARGEDVGLELPPAAPSRGALSIISFREILRQGFLTPEGRRLMPAWVAPGPAEYERAIWALGRAADAGRADAALKLIRRRAGDVDELVSARVLVTPAPVLLGRRAVGAAGVLLELEVARLGPLQRRRLPGALDATLSLARVERLLAELTPGDWRWMVALETQMELLGEDNRWDEALRRFLPHRARVLGAGDAWSAFPLVRTVLRALRRETTDPLWGPELVEALRTYMARLPEDAGEGVEHSRATLERAVGARRDRDPDYQPRETVSGVEPGP